MPPPTIHPPVCAGSWVKSYNVRSASGYLGVVHEPYRKDKKGVKQRRKHPWRVSVGANTKKRFATKREACDHAKLYFSDSDMNN